MTTPFRLGFTASRTRTDKDRIWDALDQILERHGAVLLRHGACRDGGDPIADSWGAQRKAEGHLVEVERVPAPWQLLGNIAGPMRNGYMVGLGADGWLAAIHNESRGATGCAMLAEWAGIPVWRLP